MSLPQSPTPPIASPTASPIANQACQPGHPQDLMAHRSLFLQQVRQFFLQRDFLEVETPCLIPAADPSPHLDSFRTAYQSLDHTSYQTLYLRTSPEFAMKQLVAAGYSRIFQIGKFFRNGEISPLHNPEFTGLEWYLTHADYHTLMDMTEAMIRYLWPHPSLHYQGRTLDMQSPWKRITVHEAMAQYAQLELPAEISVPLLQDACLSRNLSVLADDTWDDLFFKIFLTYVEPHLGQEQPLFLYDYPIQMAALARPKPHAPHVAERVELYIAGIELANGYSELIDASEQQRRWEEEVKAREHTDHPFHGPLDQGLLQALAWGMPPTTGIAFGLDRLLMLFRNATTLQDILPFPVSSPPALLVR